jgi:ArsR family metal-binding transcriptional regulator
MSRFSDGEQVKIMVAHPSSIANIVEQHPSHKDCYMVKIKNGGSIILHQSLIKHIFDEDEANQTSEEINDEINRDIDSRAFRNSF